MTRYCKDCKWFRKPPFMLRIFDYKEEDTAKYSKCVHPKAIEQHMKWHPEKKSLVTGKNVKGNKTERFLYCDHFRQDNWHLSCGSEGKFFEPRGH